MLKEMEDPFTEVEIKDAISCMGPLKEPGPDGLQPIFFPSQWDTIGKSVCDLIHHIFLDTSRVADINETLVVLIPKLQHPESLKQFRPISLCNVVYKIITKVIATGLRKHMPALIAPNQCSFDPGRHSTDNIVVT